MAKKKNINLQENSLSDRVYHYVALAILAVIIVCFIYPLWFVILASVSDPRKMVQTTFAILPVHFQLGSYGMVFENVRLIRSLFVSIFYTVTGTIINVIMTVLAAWPLSRKQLKGRKVIMLLITFTMYFGGGLIPTYLLVSSLGMVDTIWAILIPGALSTYNMIIMRTYFINSIPGDLEDAAMVDGCTNFRFLLQVVLPLSAPIMVVIALYYGVGRWNDFFSAMIYLNNQKLWPMQLVLREILLQNDFSSTNLMFTDFNQSEHMIKVFGMKYAVIVFATLPIMIIYPMCQKFFAKGVMVGSLKG